VLTKRLKRASKLDAFEPEMKRILEKYPDITAVRLLEELKEAGYPGGITILRERLADMRHHKEPVMRFETDPGLQGQMDWSPYTIPFRTGKATVQCFSYILGYSRRQYIDFTLHRDFFTLIRRHVDAFGHFSGGFAYNQATGQPGIELDMQKFVFIGAVARDESAIAMTKASGITSMEKWFAAKTPVKLGNTGPGAFGTDNVLKVVKAALNLPAQIISGYKGTADMRLAAESGEIDGTTWGWDSMRGTWQKAIESGIVVVVLQAVPKPFPDLPNVPLAIDLAKTAEAKQLIEYGIHFPSKITKTLALPPGTPSDRAQILQKALQETVKDAEFIAEADKAKIGLAPVTADDMRKTFEGIFKLDPGLMGKLKTILF